MSQQDKFNNIFNQDTIGCLLLFGFASILLTIVPSETCRDYFNKLGDVLNVKINSFFDFEKYKKELEMRKSTFDKDLLFYYESTIHASTPFYIGFTIMLCVILISIYMIYLYFKMKKKL